MSRDIIHNEVPFTVEEVAAAWIVHGLSAEEAIRDARAMREGIRALYEQSTAPDQDVGDGWVRSTGHAGMSFIGGFDATLYLVADVHAEGGILSPQAREAWLEQSPAHLPHGKIEVVLNELCQLGSSWAEKRDPFRRLLDRGS